MRRVDLRGFTRVHVGNNRRDAQRRIEQRENVHHGEVNFPLSDAHFAAHDFHLLFENAVQIRHAFRNPGSARREGDGGFGFGGGRRNRKRLAGRRLQRVKLRAAPEKPLADGHGMADGLKRLREYQAENMRQRNANQGGRRGFRDALQKGAAPHAGVNQDRNCADFQQREGDGNQFHAGERHHQRPVALFDAELREAMRVGIAQRVELVKGELRKFRPSAAVAPGREDDGGAKWGAGGHVA